MPHAASFLLIKEATPGSLQGRNHVMILIQSGVLQGSVLGLVPY